MTRQEPLNLRRIFLRQMRWRKMNQSDVARAIGISRQQVSMYFRGVTNLSYDSTEKLLDYFGLIQEPPAPKERPTYL